MESPSGLGGDAGTKDAGAEGTCRTVPTAYPGTSCIGMASLATTASGPEIDFADGSLLRWDSTLPSALQPYIKTAASATDDDSVWVDYETKITVVCPYCGRYTTYKLELRDSEGGKVRFFEQQGDVLPNLTASQVTDIFGVTATAIQTCTFATSGGCFTYLRTEFDQRLETVPPQEIVDATLTAVTTPNGQFQVLWDSSVESSVQRTDCEDGPAVASDTGFVAARVSP